MEGNGFRRISLHSITVSIYYCQNYIHFSCTLIILRPHQKRITRRLFYTVGYDARVIDFALNLFLTTKTAYILIVYV